MDSQRSKKRVAVIGGGIMGTSTALRLLETQSNLEVSLISKDFSPYTTGDGSAGYLFPYLLGKENCDKELEFLFSKTIAFLLKRFLSKEGPNYGIGMISVYELSESQEQLTHPFADVVLNLRPLSTKELSNFPPKYKSGYLLTSLFVELPTFLPILMEEIRAKGGSIIEREIVSFNQLAGEYDVIVNCTGIDAHRLTLDPELSPIRGQVHRVVAPWVKHAYFFGDQYIISNGETVVLGGTKQKGNYITNVSWADKNDIFEKTHEFMPSLAKAKEQQGWVGLRPFRTSIRMELEMLLLEGKPIPVVHNYGHSGCGVALFWGSAIRAAALVEKAIRHNTHEGKPSIILSKL